MQLQLRHLQWKKGTTWAKTTKNYKRRSISQTAKSCISCCIYYNSWLGDGIFLPHYIFGRRHNSTMLCKICTRSHTVAAASCDSTKHHSVCSRSNTSNPPAVKSVTRPSSAAADWQPVSYLMRDSRGTKGWSLRVCDAGNTQTAAIVPPPPLAIHRAEDMVLHSHSEREREKHNEVRGTKVLLTTMWAPPKPHFDLNLW